MANAKRSKANNDGPDLSILRPSVTTSIVGVLDVFKAYTKGTDEIRNLLTQECDIIFECKVCRNIFRCLPNFISHKRVFCKQKYNSSYHFSFPYKDFDNSDCMIIENNLVDKNNDDDDQMNNESQPPPYGGNKPNSSGATSGKDLTQIIESLLRKQKTLHQHKENILQLDNVDTSKIAVYQTLKYSRNDDIKKEMNELYREEMSKNMAKNLDENGKIVCDAENGDGKVGSSDQNNSFQCNSCQYKFDTEKMLMVHHKKKHNGSTMVYKCPSCPSTFLQIASVMKHLSSEHNKSQRRIRSLRHNIARKRFRLDETNPKETIVKPATEIEIVPEKEAPNKAITVSLATIKRSPSTITDERPTKLRRNADLAATKSSTPIEMPTLNRPIRNRIQKNHKDFIYDLPNISTTVSFASTPTSPNKEAPPKRRNTIQDILPANKEPDTIITYQRRKPAATINSCKDSAFLMAKKMVDKSKAAFKYNPKLKMVRNGAEKKDKDELANLNLNPTPSLILTRRSTRRSLYIEQATGSDVDPPNKSMYKIRVRNNLFDTANNTEFTSKPGSSSSPPATSSAAVNSSSTHRQLVPVSKRDFIVKCPTATEFQQYLVTNKLTDPVKKIMLVPNYSVDTK